MLDIKSNGDIARTEVSIPIEENDYLSILGVINKPPIEKIFKEYDAGNGLKFEATLIDGELLVGEVEFSDMREALNWQIPETLKPCMVEDVTLHPEYKMKNYWERTRIEGSLK